MIVKHYLSWSTHALPRSFGKKSLGKALWGSLPAALPSCLGYEVGRWELKPCCELLWMPGPCRSPVGHFPSSVPVGKLFHQDAAVTEQCWQRSRAFHTSLTIWTLPLRDDLHSLLPENLGLKIYHEPNMDPDSTIFRTDSNSCIIVEIVS